MFNWAYDGVATVVLHFNGFDLPTSLAGSDPDSSPTLNFQGNGTVQLQVGNAGDPSQLVFGCWLWPASDGNNGGAIENRLYFNGVYGTLIGDNTLTFGVPSAGAGEFAAVAQALVVAETLTALWHPKRDSLPESPVDWENIPLGPGQEPSPRGYLQFTQEGDPIRHTDVRRRPDYKRVPVVHRPPNNPA